MTEEKPTYLTGVQNVDGSFEGEMTTIFEDEDWSALLGSTTTTTISLYAPADLPWWRRLWIRITRQPWPDELVFVGDVVKWEGEEGAIKGSFTAKGVLVIPGEENAEQQEAQ